MARGRKRSSCTTTTDASGSQNEDEEMFTQPPSGKKKVMTKKIEAPRDLDGKIILSIDDSIWFGHPDVSQLVATTIRSNFTYFCPTWKKTPGEVREKWWNYFKGGVKFESDPEVEVKKAFFDKVKDRLRDILHYTNNDGERPDWMPETSFVGLKAYRNSAAFKKMSTSGKANQAKYAVGDKIPGTHNMGSISSIELAERMEKYESRKTRLQEKGEEFVEDDLFAEVVGGFKKGRLYGIGSSADYYYKDKSTCSSSMIDTSTTATSYVGIRVLGRVQAENAKVLEQNAKLKEENQKLK
ncbi:hypothetical protein RND81_06G045500 [Saponaria officinalis]|uniref:Transposase, Ptta/En/Spm, plant n=1 Tax=Saponaria officinalis TaxID=3572 RepID=A0AAW1K7V1_SAPOF